MLNILLILKKPSLFHFPKTPLIGNRSPKIEILIQNRPVSVVIDTGADVSVLPKSVLTQLLHELPANAPTQTVQSFGGKEILSECAYPLTVSL